MVISRRARAGASLGVGRPLVGIGMYVVIDATLALLDPWYSLVRNAEWIPILMTALLGVPPGVLDGED